MTFRVETIGDATLYLGDCREVMASWPECFRVDAVVTDPPYGVDFDGKTWHSTNRGKTIKRNQSYASHADSEGVFKSDVIPALSAAIKRADCSLVFMADRTLSLLPRWVGLGGIFSPAGTGLSSWGFQCFMHCAFYGKDPYLAQGLGSRPTGRYGLYGNDSNDVAHPCAKPIQAMMWAVERGSLAGHTVLDPFAGSGTTGVACAKLGRKFIGIEIEPKYFDIACRRIEEAYKQPRLFAEPAPKPEQLNMLDGAV